MENKKKLSKFSKAVIVEIMVLCVLTVVLRIWVLPYLAHGGMLHVALSTHVFMIGLTATAFTLFAVFFKRGWRGHKKYILIPGIFTVFGYILLALANEMNF
ncbi:MAG: hypothetical protein IKU60_04270 [Clostridia bacterium]|nr:hypothetical protein [Clostridia bacterium]